MKSLFFFILSVWLIFTAQAQVKISGSVVDDAGDPIPYATVYINETFEGGSSDVDGSFHFKSDSKGSFILVASAVGFETTKKQILIDAQPVNIQLKLMNTSRVLGPVVISAGAFEASDKAKAAILKPMDIVTNAGAQADIYKAIQTLPGVSQVGEETGLFVRGGEAHETKTIIDGVIVEKPFYSETPDVASRSRFDPFMFTGTIFSTGGYSAEYGSALSSVLILETQDIPESSVSSIGINMVGANFSHQQLWNNQTTLIGDVSYHNLGLLYHSVPHNVDMVKKPEGFGTNWAFRHKTKSGMFKTLVQYQQGKISLHTTNWEDEKNPHLFSNDNNTLYWNTHYTGTLSDKLGIYTGFGYNQNEDDISFDSNMINEKSRMLHGKVNLFYDLSSKASLKSGLETYVDRDAIKTDDYQGKLADQYSAVFAESDIEVGKRIAVRLGFRSEYSHMLGEVNIAPRTSMAYKTGKDSQISLAYGHFYQKPEGDYLYYSTDLNYEMSTHLIANYQWITSQRSFRIEVYDKRYRSLIKGKVEEQLTNDGGGYSRGIDVFWKDKKTIRNLDYWISYSFIDAERDYKDYPVAATPGFVTDHTLNLVANYSMEGIGLRPGLTYTFASGRRFFNPNNEQFLSDQTKAYHNLSMNVSYVTELFGKFTVIYGSLSNPFGIDQVFGYRYSPDGLDRRPIKPTADRSFFLGFFVNL